MVTPELHIVDDPEPCCCDPEAGIACDIAIGIMEQIHDALRKFARVNNAARYLELKEQLRLHYLTKLEAERAEAV